MNIEALSLIYAISLNWGYCLEGQGDLASRLIVPISHIVTLDILIISLLTKFL